MTAEQKVEFDRDRANQYDLDIRKAIPGYEALHSMTQSLLATSLSPTANLLIVGSGTGMELINYCQQKPQWSLTGVDPSLDMMEIAKQELDRRKLLERVNLHTGYLNTLPVTELMDAATLILVMDFIQDDGSKLQLLKNIANHLKPGAEFILADLYGEKSAAYFAKFKQAWQTLYFSQLDDTGKAKAEQNFEASIENSIYFISEARIIELLNIAGFSQVTKFYNAFLFGGWTAKYTGN
ncbi:methyltransferase domain-containing protein [Waterburya agarophytonicola K14]|uniref:Methyltransferase domain-containing protein n=1 Tax=Waterburya agarophytonicola KI4 TaxID=2874699 RepID=A0A964FH52_9CYAN|nr:class I SAM-dependent methyltransferase [Waterburya agarophytonicola]MCC0177148.1 methyltransferase domain-containing protein [Waterburya agarophytonicola KI4]